MTTIRRRMYGGESAPVMEIVHPDAIYIKTNEYAEPNGTFIWQNGLSVSNITKLIFDGEEVTPSDYLTQSGINVMPVLSGVHEYYIYTNKENINLKVHSYNTESIFRCCRGNNIVKIRRDGSARPLDIIITDKDNVPNLSDVYMGNNCNIYVPIECASTFGAENVHLLDNASIIYVKYKFIED